MGISKNRGKNPKMDGENHGKPYEQMDDLGGKTKKNLIFGNTHINQLVFLQEAGTFTINLWFSCR